LAQFAKVTISATDLDSAINNSLMGFTLMIVDLMQPAKLDELPIPDNLEELPVKYLGANWRMTIQKWLLNIPSFD
jgi:hypothetical protein